MFVKVFYNRLDIVFKRIVPIYVEQDFKIRLSGLSSKVMYFKKFILPLPDTL